MDVRALRRFACTRRHSVPGHALLALPQLPDILALPLRYPRDMGSVLVRSSLQTQLDTPVAYVLADRG